MGGWASIDEPADPTMGGWRSIVESTDPRIGGSVDRRMGIDR